MFRADLPQTFWLTLTNVVLGTAVLIGLTAILAAVIHEAAIKVYKLTGRSKTASESTQNNREEEDKPEARGFVIGA